ncbi:MAG: carboxypeptidase-like regulatory domain-containing protein, partial [Planctomycetaceae bacterium]
MSQHDLTADLPPPRDDEPSSLRQDIIDELTDHLECATRRELLINTTASGGRQSPLGDELTAAQSRALTRFGNPAKIARQLWLDAMQEKLMAQKITLTLASVATVACIVLCVLMWRFVENSHAADQARLAAQQEANSTLFAKLTEMIDTRSEPVGATEGGAAWIEMFVRLVDEGGQPVKGHVQLVGQSFEGGTAVGAEADTNDEGLAELESLPPGNYHINLTTERTNERHGRSAVIIGPGRPTVIQIVCPSSPPPATELTFDFDLPSDLPQDRVYFIAQIYKRHRTVDSWEWKPTETQPEYFLLDAKGRAQGQGDLGQERMPIVGAEGWSNKMTLFSPHLERVSAIRMPGYTMHVQIAPLLTAFVNAKDGNGFPYLRSASLDGLLSWSDLGYKSPDSDGEIQITHPMISPVWEQIRNSLPSMQLLQPAYAVLVHDTEGHTPAIGFRTLVCDGSRASEAVKLSTTATGTAEFAVKQPGPYWFDITTPWGEETSIIREIGIGEPRAEQIIVPSAPPEPEEVELQVRVNVPLDLEEAGFHLQFYVTKAGRTVGDAIWMMSEDDRTDNRFQKLVMIPGDPTIHRVTDQEFPDDGESRLSTYNLTVANNFETARYGITGFQILRLIDHPNTARETDSTSDDATVGEFEYAAVPLLTISEDSPFASHQLVGEFIDEKSQVFEPQPDIANVWRINLTDQFWNLLREEIHKSS